MKPSLAKLDLSVLVDVLSNAAGMMLLMACFALVLRQQSPGGSAASPELLAKPITFPLAYIPNKRSVTLALKFGKLYRLPEVEMLQAVTERASQGTPVHFLDLEKDGVSTRIAVTETATGFRFLYTLQPEGGVPLTDATKVKQLLQEMVKRYPAEHFFFVIHTWPDSVVHYRDIREFLHEQQMEVGWMPRSTGEGDQVDIAYSIGEYDEDLTSIKAQ
jgi:hypothetical protein